MKDGNFTYHDTDRMLVYERQFLIHELLEQFKKEAAQRQKQEHEINKIGHR